MIYEEVMEIRKTYKFEYEKDGKTLHGISSGFLPDYATKVLDETDVLYPAKGKALKRIDGEDILSYIILKEDDSMDNYEEVDKPERERPERRIKDAE